VAVARRTIYTRNTAGKLVRIRKGETIPDDVEVGAWSTEEGGGGSRPEPRRKEPTKSEADVPGPDNADAAEVEYPDGEPDESWPRDLLHRYAVNEWGIEDLPGNASKAAILEAIDAAAG
jgi:hypothetical protein